MSLEKQRYDLYSCVDDEIRDIQKLITSLKYSDEKDKNLSILGKVQDCIGNIQKLYSTIEDVENEMREEEARSEEDNDGYDGGFLGYSD